MAAPTGMATLPINVTITGSLTCATFNAPAGCILDVNVLAAANIAATKLIHQHEQIYSQPFASSAAAERKVVHVTVAASVATLLSIAFGATTAAIGAATAVFDFLKNGVSILTAQITLTSATAAFVLVPGVIAGGSFTSVAGDVFELNVVSATAGGGTLAKGLFARFVIQEAAA